MGRTIGKWWIAISLLLVMSFQNHAAQLSLQVTDMQGVQLDQVQAGETFLLVVTTSDPQDDQQEPKISGLQDLAVKRIGYRMATMNGKKTVHHTYQVRIDKPGTFVLGPAYDPGMHKRSNTVKIKVESDAVPTSTVRRERRVRKEAQSEQVFLRLFGDVDTAFVGQKIKMALRFYVPEGIELSLDQIISHDPPSVSSTKKIGPRKGREQIDNKGYQFYEWNWDMFIQAAGDLVLPAYALDYTKHVPIDHYAGTFAAFFGPRSERKKVYSNALTLKVLPLPDTDEKTQAVGRYVSYRAHISPTVVKQYEGMVLTLVLEGDGNLEQISVPDLEGMPDVCKWYASKNYTEQLTVGQRRTFEYIVQGLKEGDWQIPEQTFSFFDVDLRMYKKLRTASLFFTVWAGATQPIQQVSKTKSDEHAQVNPKQLMTIQLPIVDALDHQASRALPWSLFLLLMLLPLGGVMGRRAAGLMHGITSRMMPHYAKKRAFAYAQKRLAHTYQAQDVKALYLIFTDLFSARLQQAVVQVQEIELMIDQSMLTDTHKQRWRTFFAEIYEAAYVHEMHTENIQRLFHDAASWLQELQRII